jgi:hypothetical protein
VPTANRPLIRWLGFRLGLVGLGLFALSRSAEASSCHLDERPSLGIQLPGEKTSIVSFSLTDLEDSTLPTLRRTPCPGEQSSPSARPQIAQPAHLTMVPVDLSACLDDEVDEESSLRPPLATFLPLERPPRRRFGSFEC